MKEKEQGKSSDSSSSSSRSGSPISSYSSKCKEKDDGRDRKTKFQYKSGSKEHSICPDVRSITNKKGRSFRVRRSSSKSSSEERSPSREKVNEVKIKYSSPELLRSKSHERTVYGPDEWYPKAKSEKSTEKSDKNNKAFSNDIRTKDDISKKSVHRSSNKIQSLSVDTSSSSSDDEGSSLKKNNRTQLTNIETSFHPKKKASSEEKDESPDRSSSNFRKGERKDKILTVEDKIKDRKSSRDARNSRDDKSRSPSRILDKKTVGSKRSVTRSRSRSRSSARHIKRDKSPRRDRRRSRSRDRHYHRDRSPRRRGSKTRGRRSRSRESHRRSRSRSYDRRRGRYRRYRSSSRDRYKRRRRSRSSSRSRSRSRISSRERSKGHSGAGNSKLGSLPLSTTSGAMTPQMALQQTMALMNAKAQALTGIALPKYYNPAAVNPLKYAEQVQKRKLLWQSKDKAEEQQPKNSVWDKLTFAQDQDGKMTAKFRKLMGIKAEGDEGQSNDSAEHTVVEDVALKKQEELFRDLDQQYEMARMSTHTHRGVGLGYSTQTIFPPIQK